MLKIESRKQMDDSQELAKKTGTFDQLLKMLLYLACWGSEETVVHVGADIPYSAGFISWYAERGDGKVFYNGGLVFHESCNEWSIHS